MSSDLEVDLNIFDSVTENFESEDWLFLLTQDDLLESEPLQNIDIHPSIVLEECGQNSPDWLEFLNHFTSAKLYNNRVLHFIEWMMSHREMDEDIIASLKKYFWFHHDQKKMVKGIEKALYAPPVFRSWFSMLNKFWKVTEKGDLKVLCPALYESFTDWETGYTQSHAHEFTKEEMLRYHTEAPDDEEHLVIKAYTICATAYASRSSETHDMAFEYRNENTGTDLGIKLLPDGSFSIKYERNKVRGLRTLTDQHCLIQGDLEIKCLQKYLNTFPDSTTMQWKKKKEKIGADNHFFRKLGRDSTTKELVASLTNIGKNKAARFGIDIANFLGLKDPLCYTGQCWRGTACTYLADAGFTKVQIKQITGHKSDSAVEKYIANSVKVKESAADALSLSGTTRRSLPTTDIHIEPKKLKTTKQTMFHFTINTSDSAKCNIHIGKDDEESSACDDD